MKESLNIESNNDIKNTFRIFTKNIELFKYYALNKFKNISNKSNSIYPFSSNKQNHKSNNSKNAHKLNLLPKEKNLIIKKINNNENKLLIYNNFKIKKNICAFLENELKINDTKIELRNSKNQITQINKYKEFKDKTLIYFFSSIIIEKYYNIISITSLCILSLLKNINSYSKNENIKLILDTLWNLTNKTSKSIFTKISEIMTDIVEKILLNEKFTKEKLNELISNILNQLRDKCNFFGFIIKEVKNEINELEEQFYDFNNIKNNKIIEYKLKYLYIFCDILYSDFFYSTFVEAFEYEFFRQLDDIKINFEEKKTKTLLAIIFDIDSFKNKLYIINEEEYVCLKNKNENNDDILMNYQQCLQSIFS